MTIVASENSIPVQPHIMEGYGNLLWNLFLKSMGHTKPFGFNELQTLLYEAAANLKHFTMILRNTMNQDRLNNLK